MLGFMHHCAFHCVRRKVSVNMSCRRSTEYVSAIPLLTQLPERNLNIFSEETLYSVGSCISESRKSSRPYLFPRVTGRIDTRAGLAIFVSLFFP